MGNSCPLGWPSVLIVFCLFVILVISHFGFESGIRHLIALVRVHCLFSLKAIYLATEYVEQH